MFTAKLRSGLALTFPSHASRCSPASRAVSLSICGAMELNMAAKLGASEFALLVSEGSELNMAANSRWVQAEVAPLRSIMARSARGARTPTCNATSSFRRAESPTCAGHDEIAPSSDDSARSTEAGGRESTKLAAVAQSTMPVEKMETAGCWPEATSSDSIRAASEEIGRAHV